MLERRSVGRTEPANLIDGTQMPEEIYRGRLPSWTYPARRYTEPIIALYIDAGEVAADPHHGDRACRSSVSSVRTAGEIPSRTRENAAPNGAPAGPWPLTSAGRR